MLKTLFLVVMSVVMGFFAIMSVFMEEPGYSYDDDDCLNIL